MRVAVIRRADVWLAALAMLLLLSPSAAGEFYAVVVGVADYPGTANDLSFTDDDARDVSAALAARPAWSSGRVTLLLDASATKAGLQEAVRSLTMGADTEDTLFLYFSGHGTTGPDVPPLDEVDGRDEYLCTYGSSLADFVRDDELGTWLGELSVGRIVVVLDSCFSGGAAKGVRSLNMGEPPAQGDGFERDLAGATALSRDIDDVAGCIAAMMAADDREYAYELGHPYNHGLFTFYVLEAMGGSGDLDGDGWATVSECYEYTQPRVQAFSDLFHLQQHPQFHDACLVPFSFLDEDPEVVVFADSGLEGAVRGALSQPSGDLRRSDVAALTTLDAVGRGIVDLAGLEHCTGLTALDLSDNQTADLTTLSGLALLTDLRVTANRIQAVGSLAGLAALETLLLDRNEISDVAPLLLNPGLGSGDRLDLRWNDLDMSPGSEDLGDIQALIERGVDVAFEPQRAACAQAEHQVAAAGWHMASLPGALCGTCGAGEGSICGDLACAISDDLDPLVAYRYAPSARSYQVISPSSATCHQPGMGFWIYSASEVTVLDALVTVPMDPVELALEEGWSQIGNPFEIDVSAGSLLVRCGTDEVPLVEAETRGWLSATLFWYDTIDGAYAEIESVSGCIPAWTGCWVRTYRAGCTIVFQPTACGASPTEARPLSATEARALGVPPPPPFSPQSTEVRDALAEMSVSNEPNPVRSEHTTTFGVTGPKSDLVSAIRVEICDLSGQLVWREEIEAKELAWHTVNDAGELLANGVYLYRVWVKIGGIWFPLEVQKLAVLR